MKRLGLLFVLCAGCHEARDDALEEQVLQDESAPSTPFIAKKTPTEVAALLTFAGIEQESRGIDLTKRAFVRLAGLFQEREQLAGQELTNDQVQRIREFVAQQVRFISSDMAAAERRLGGTSKQRYVKLWNWLARRSQDELARFQTDYARFVADGFEIEFCKYAYRRWPPDSGRLGPELR